MASGSFNNALTLNTMTGLENFGLNKTTAGLSGDPNSRNNGLHPGGGEF